MKIGFDAKRAFHNATGLGGYSRDVLRILPRSRPEHTYAAYTPRPGCARFGPFDDVETRGPRGPLSRVLPALWRSRGILRDLTADRIDLFHGLSGELPLGIERTGIASVVTIHDLVFERLPELYPPLDRRIYSAKARSAARRAAIVVAVSEQTKRDLAELYGADPSRVRVVYQTCGEIFRVSVPRGRLDEVATRYDLPERFLLAVGTIERRKNLLLVLRALEKLPGVLLVAVGRPTQYAGEVVDFARRHRLANRVRLLSGVSREDLAAMYRLATVALYPSLYEGFGIPIIEALSSGTPVVTTRGGCFEEAAGPGSSYVDPNDPDGLAEVLSRLLEDGELRARMRDEGLCHVTRFSDEAVAEGLFAAYEDALALGRTVSRTARAS